MHLWSLSRCIVSIRFSLRLFVVLNSSSIRSFSEWKSQNGKLQSFTSRSAVHEQTCFSHTRWNCHHGTKTDFAPANQGRVPSSLLSESQIVDLTKTEPKYNGISRSTSLDTGMFKHLERSIKWVSMVASETGFDIFREYECLHYSTSSSSCVVDFVLRNIMRTIALRFSERESTDFWNLPKSSHRYCFDYAGISPLVVCCILIEASRGRRWPYKSSQPTKHRLEPSNGSCQRRPQRKNGHF